jgi:hypothetical protein
MREYLEDFVARIDTPVLSQVYTELARDLVFDIPHFTQFIGRARGLKPSKAPRVLFESRSILLEFSPGSTLRINRHRIDWGISSIVLICGQLSPFFSLVERLDLVATYDLQAARDRQHRTHPLPRTLPSIYRYRGSLCIRESCAAYCTCTAGAHRGKGHRSVTQAARSFLGGTCNSWICPGSHTTICRRTTALRSTYRYPSLGREVSELVIYWCRPLFTSHRSALICSQPHLTLSFIHVVSRLLEAFVTFTTNSATILIPNPVHRITVLSLAFCEC